MRPRHKAAENDQRTGAGRCPGPASMRPRHKAAENALTGRAVAGHPLASMRPRHKAAENPPWFHVLNVSGGRFNEAAA